MEGFAMRDIRTPSAYFQERNERKQQLDAVKSKLDDLLAYLQILNQAPGQSKTHQALVTSEMKRVQKKVENKVRQEVSKSIVDSILDDDTLVAVEKMKEYEISGHITLKKGERSSIATLASKIL